MSESVKVAVRCRPISQKELAEGCQSVVTIDPHSKSCTLEGDGNTGKVYQFDAAFGSTCSTEKVYDDVGSVVVEAVLEGYNGTVFAYGQTGCGKSHTMHGFIERTLEHIFEATSTASSDTRYLALLSYLEIYNERIRDLLQDDDGSLQLKEDPVRGTYVAGLREVTVKDAVECSSLVKQGDKRRVAAFTKMNASSSRSHAVLTISLEALAMNEGTSQQGGAVRRGRLHLVDLAGSERQARTGATGERLKEAASINLSLSALGNVISALAAGNGRHVPYRDSKLTRLLRDSLGGNARTLMIACISPCDVDAEETLSTLRYAARARCIKNKPIVNEDPKDALLRQYQLELQRLRKLLESSPKTDDDIEEDEEREDGERSSQVEKLKRECEETNLSSQKLREELECLRNRYENNREINEPSDKNLVWTSMTREVDERRRKKREAAQREVMRRLERLTIGGEAQGNTELKRRRERRRRRLQILAAALEASAQDGSESAFEVYGQLKTTEDALKRMAKRTKQLEAEALDLQASWDAERRELLRRELLATQICEAMVPYLRPGCPFRDLTSIRSAATWCDELNRWRLPDFSSRIPLPPAPPINRDNLRLKPDHNNNNDDRSSDDDSRANEAKSSQLYDIAGTYFRRNRIDQLLARAREAKTFETNGRLSKSGGSDDSSSGYQQLNSLNLQGSAPTISELSTKIPLKSLNSGRPVGAFNAWTTPDATKPLHSPLNSTSLSSVKKIPPPRILEALPSYPLGSPESRTPS
ncbi:osmotic avoidance abnormal protein 3-like [Chelonus insularis]|uniref:osmotic avoidance abnormal protein 3-like n=1 Tax=Chelonus insularis TaxID=460826 RepID=UPI00158B51F1|nr:osmotic avoidance abnormal protein 3-like [Chelonus insularis]XP_034952060.1 osmotic avoidance abnormal protein 3-like [Chelonus insularis]